MSERLNFRVLNPNGERSLLGESPFYDSAVHDLWWVDIDGCSLHQFGIRSGHQDSWRTPEQPGFVVLAGPGRQVVGMQSCIFTFNPEQRKFERLVIFEQVNGRFNDATVDTEGGLWVSTMDRQAQPGAGAIHHVTSSFELGTLVQRLTIPNGLAVDSANRRLFYSDSFPSVQQIWTLDGANQSDGFQEPEPFASTRQLAGRPDGAAMDCNGRFWIAGVDGGELSIFASDGELEDIIDVPVDKPTKVSSTQSDGRHIAITSKSSQGDGGLILVAEIPDPMPSGVVQPYWNLNL